MKRTTQTVLTLLLALTVLAALTTQASALNFFRWYFGTQDGGFFDDDASRWYLDYPSTASPVPCGYGVQLINVGPNGLIDAPPNAIDCMPTGDDYLAYISDGLTAGDERNTFDANYNPGPNDGVCDNVNFTFTSFLGRFNADGSPGPDNWPGGQGSGLDGTTMYVRVFDAATCAAASEYADSTTYTVNWGTCPGGDCVDTSTFPQDMVFTSFKSTTPTPTRTSTIVVPTATLAPTATATATLAPTATATSTGGPSPTRTATLAATQTPTMTPTGGATQVPTPLITDVDMANKEKPASGRDTSVDITWASVNGLDYQVQYTDTYDPPSWNDLGGPVTALGPFAATSDLTVGPIDGSTTTQRFYRVRTLVGGLPVNSSRNVAGVVCITSCNATYKIAGLSIDPYDGPDIQSLIGWQMHGGNSDTSGDVISTWNGSDYDRSFMVDLDGDDENGSAYDGLWYNVGGSAPSADTLALGEGFWMTTRSGTEYAWIEGELPESDVLIDVPAGAGSQDLFANPYVVDIPVNNPADNLGYQVDGGVSGGDALAADSILFRDCGAAYETIFLNPGGAWELSGGGLPAAPPADTLNVNEGAWIHRGTGAGPAVNWTIPKPYAAPPF